MDLKTMLEFNVLVHKKDGGKFDPKEFSKVLTEAGYTFSGTMELYEDEDLRENAKEVVEQINEKIMKEIKEKIKEKEKIETEEKFKEYFFYNHGMSYYLLKEYVSKDLKKEMTKNFKSNWIVSDTYLSYLESGIVNKFFNGEYI